MNYENLFVNIYQQPIFANKIAPKLYQMIEVTPNKMLTPSEIIDYLKYFYRQVSMLYPHKTVKIYDYDFMALLEIYGKKLPIIFSNIARQILKISKYQKTSIQILYAHKNREINLKKQQVIYLLCLMSLMLVPPQRYHFNPKKKYQFNTNNNFGYIFSCVQFKTIAIINFLHNYFQTDCSAKNEILTISRNVTPYHLQQLLGFQRNRFMAPLTIQQNKDSIEKYVGSTKVDFANQMIGGGVMKNGACQQEIMFATHPQMFVSCILCQRMHDNQSLYFIGFKKYFQSKGYRQTTQIIGQAELENFKKDEKNRAMEYIIAIDALNFKNSKVPQSDKLIINRQIIKAYSGFQCSIPDTITTGNWGCGAFGGDVELKFLIQWIAATLAHKKLRYCPFGQKQLLQKYQQFEKCRVYDIYKIITQQSHKKSMIYSKSSLRKSYYSQIKESLKNAKI